MNAYLSSVIEHVKTRHANEPEFVQTVEEVLSSLEPVIEKHPEYEKVDLLTRMVEPERMFTFRVCWMADDGTWHTNIGYRCQFNGAIGPYKGGLRFQKNVYGGLYPNELQALQKDYADLWGPLSELLEKLAQVVAL